MAHTPAAALADLAGRANPGRADSRDTHAKLIHAVNQWVATHGTAPIRLADVAMTAGVSIATAYRHFASVDDAIQAFVLQLPVRAFELFDASSEPDEDAVDRFHRWNRSWVASCVEHGQLAVHLRSARGFLERRDSGEPVISYACARIEPLLEPLDGDSLLQLFTWNVTSDPREVLDLLRLGWSEDQIAEFVTRSVLATPVIDTAPATGRRDR
jgi:AcrR family transcriptional regulator